MDLAKLGMSLFNSFAQSRANGWARGSGVNNLNFLDDQYGNFWDLFAGAGENYAPYFGLGLSIPNYQLYGVGMDDPSQAFGNQLMDDLAHQGFRTFKDFRNWYDDGLNTSPFRNEMNATSSALGGTADDLRFLAGRAGGDFMDRGMTPEALRGLEFAGSFMDPNSNPYLSKLGNTGNWLVDNFGRDAYSTGVSDQSKWGIEQWVPQDFLSGAMGEAQRRMAGGGGTAQSKAGIDAALGLISGGGWSPQAGAMSDLGAGIMSGGGWSPQAGTLSDLGTGIAQGGGWSPGAGKLGDAGGLLLGAEGMNPLLEGLAGAGQAGVQGAGQNDISRMMAQRGAGYAMEDPLLGMDQAIGMARDQAGTAARQQAEAMRRQALARGGGPGNIVSAGSQNNQMNEFADQISQAQASAARDAMFKQQELQLQKAGLGQQMMAGAGGLENQRLGTYGDIAGQAQSLANQRMGMGGQFTGQSVDLANQRLGLGFGALRDALSGANQRLGIGVDASQNALTGANQRLGLGFDALQGLGNQDLQGWQAALNAQVAGQGQAANMLGTLGNLFTGAEGLGVQRMGLGAGMTQNALQAMLQGGQQYNQFLGQQQNYGLGSGQLAMNLNNAAAGLNQQQLQNMFQGWGLGSQQQQRQMDQWLQSMQQRQGYANMLSNNLNFGMNNAQNMMQMFGNMLTNTLNNRTQTTTGLIGTGGQPLPRP